MYFTHESDSDCGRPRADRDAWESKDVLVVSPEVMLEEG